MSTNFKGDPLSNEQIYQFAQKLRKSFGLEDHEVPDLLELYKSPSIFTRFGVKQFTYKVVPDLESKAMRLRHLSQIATCEYASARQPFDEQNH